MAQETRLHVCSVHLSTFDRETHRYPAAIACNLANDLDIVIAVRAACRYVDAGIRTSTDLGKGSGPLNHFHSLQILPFAPGYFIDYVLSLPEVKQPWHEFTHHEFVRRMGDGSLPRDTFKYYMIQDYLYLVHFARAHALAGYKTKNLDDIALVSKLPQSAGRVVCWYDVVNERFP
jgi:hypothetical protein